jgi:hypothetical protein
MMADDFAKAKRTVTKLTCSVHGSHPALKQVKTHTGFEGHVEACCGELVARAKKALSKV